MKRIEGEYTKSPCGSSSAIITRPDNTTTYAAGDIVGTNPATNITFANILPYSGGHFYITDLKLEIVKSSVPANMSTFTLHLYNAAPTAIADNAQWTLLAADGAKYLGSIDITLPEDLGETLIMFETKINKKCKLAASSTTIYGQLVTNGNYQPASQDVHKVTLETVAA